MKHVGTDEFIKLAKYAVYDTMKEGMDVTDNVTFTPDDIYMVTCAYVLGNIKGMFSSTLPNGKYYEVTYNAHTSEMYIDEYVKFKNRTFDVPYLENITSKELNNNE